VNGDIVVVAEQNLIFAVLRVTIGVNGMGVTCLPGICVALLAYPSAVRWL